jgi:hypothetical protein
MSRILILAKSGFGKSTGIGPTPEIGIVGLDPATSYVLSVTTKPLPFRGSDGLYKVTTWDNLRGGRRITDNNPAHIETALKELAKVPSSAVKTVVIDDFNYLMQDWYMENAHKTGWEAPKKIGQDMGKVFKAIELFNGIEKNVIVLAHGEDVPQADSRIYTKMKTTGKMVDEYVTPEGKFDVVLVGRSSYDSTARKVVKQYLTNEDEFYMSAKSPYGMFDELLISNDLGAIVEKVEKYYKG